jgi:ABC-type Na+ efflux pump permease subunit
MTLSTTRIRAIVRKELHDYRRNRFIASTMTIVPVVFIALPIVDIFKFSSSAAVSGKIVGATVLYLLLIPALVPSAIAAYAIVGEREQGTLEPVLTTPVRREEFLLGKALAALIPTIAISYAMYGIFLGVVAAFANQNVASEIFQAPRILAQLLLTPLLAGWSIWAGIAVSARSGDVRVAQQIGTLASLPPLAVTALMGFGVPRPAQEPGAHLRRARRLGGRLQLPLAADLAPHADGTGRARTLDRPQAAVGRRGSPSRARPGPRPCFPAPAGFPQCRGSSPRRRAAPSRGSRGP